MRQCRTNRNMLLRLLSKNVVFTRLVNSNIPFNSTSSSPHLGMGTSLTSNLWGYDTTLSAFSLISHRDSGVPHCTKALSLFPQAFCGCRWWSGNEIEGDEREREGECRLLPHRQEPFYIYMFILHRETEEGRRRKVDAPGNR